MKGMIKRFLCLAIAMILVLSLSACSADPCCGKYVLKTAKVDDITVDADDAFVNGASIELKSTGACEVVLDGATYKASWKRADSKLTITLQETESEGILSGNTYTVDLFSVGMTLTFEKVGKS